MPLNVQRHLLRAARRPRRPRLVRWPRFTLVSTLVLLALAVCIELGLPSWLPAGRALALFALVHASFLCALEPGPAGGDE